MEYAIEYRKGTRWNQSPDRDYRYMECKLCGQFESVSEDTTAVTCHECVMEMCEAPVMTTRRNVGRPSGWHFMKEFVDKDGNVFHLGKEQPKLKGTLPPTKVKPKKKTTKRRTKEQILLARAAEKKAALKKAVKKQKDFLNHKFGK